MTNSILLVDDERGFVQILAERLKFRVILDVRMPGIDGIGTLREIKMMWPLTEVILLTGHAATETAIEGVKGGAFDYLIKPAQIEELLEKIGAAAAHKAAQEQEERPPVGLSDQ
ncbi:MAG: response regulator [Deltaproteobacteria bacterium]